MSQGKYLETGWNNIFVSAKMYTEGKKCFWQSHPAALFVIFILCYSLACSIDEEEFLNILHYLSRFSSSSLACRAWRIKSWNRLSQKENMTLLTLKLIVTCVTLRRLKKNFERFTWIWLYTRNSGQTIKLSIDEWLWLFLSTMISSISFYKTTQVNSWCF